MLRMLSIIYFYIFIFINLKLIKIDSCLTKIYNYKLKMTPIITPALANEYDKLFNSITNDYAKTGYDVLTLKGIKHRNLLDFVWKSNMDDVKRVVSHLDIVSAVNAIKNKHGDEYCKKMLKKNKNEKMKWLYYHIVDEMMCFRIKEWWERKEAEEAEADEDEDDEEEVEEDEGHKEQRNIWEMRGRLFMALCDWKRYIRTKV